MALEREPDRSSGRSGLPVMTTRKRGSAPALSGNVTPIRPRESGADPVRQPGYRRLLVQNDRHARAAAANITGSATKPPVPKTTRDEGLVGAKRAEHAHRHVHREIDHVCHAQ